jgi:hypothetical protein
LPSVSSTSDALYYSAESLSGAGLSYSAGKGFRGALTRLTVGFPSLRRPHKGFEPFSGEGCVPSVAPMTGKRKRALGLTSYHPPAAQLGRFDRTLTRSPTRGRCCFRGSEARGRRQAARRRTPVRKLAPVSVGIQAGAHGRRHTGARRFCGDRRVCRRVEGRRDRF